MKAFVVLLLLSAAAHAETIECISIRDITGKAKITARGSFERKISGSARFSDDHYNYFFEYSYIGIFAHIAEIGSRNEIIAKANFPEEKPYFDLIFPITPARGKAHSVDVEVECKPGKS